LASRRRTVEDGPRLESIGRTFGDAVSAVVEAALTRSKP
jgi:hypothetical protein